jgi:catechol 2,3-dioxygenase-like lactoylglutathione lyase family enzyme
MDLAQGLRTGSVSRREALALLGTMAVMHSAGAVAAEQGITQPVSLDHVNIRVSSVAKTAEFLIGLLDTPVLRNPALRAQPNSPPSEGYFLRFGDGYLAISQAFAPDMPGLDHYSLGLRDYDKAKLAAKLQDGGIAALQRSSTDLWVSDLDGSLMQLRQPGGWARQTATPYQVPPRTGPSLSPLSMSRIGLPSANLARGGDFYGKLFGTEIASAASSRSRAFSVGDSVLELTSAPANSGSSPATGAFHIRIAVKDFTVENATRVLRARGIKTDDKAAPGTVRIADPDGIPIELASAG